jgi:hypothetical protein
MGEPRCLITCSCEVVKSKVLVVVAAVRTKFSFADFGLMI